MTKGRPNRQPQRLEDKEWLRRLDRIAHAVDAWRKCAENPVSAEPGSSLVTDSIEGLRVENPVWYSMCISSEHLDFAIDAMRATSTMYPTAYMTVCCGGERGVGARTINATRTSRAGTEISGR